MDRMGETINRTAAARALLGLAPSPARDRDLSVSVASSADSADVAGGRGKRLLSKVLVSHLCVFKTNRTEVQYNILLHIYIVSD